MPCCNLRLAQGGQNSEVDHLVVRGGSRFHHRLTQGGVRVDGLDEFVTGGLELAQGDNLCDHLRHVGANHVAAEEFAVLGVEDELHKAVLVSGGARLA